MISKPQRSSEELNALFLPSDENKLIKFNFLIFSVTYSAIGSAATFTIGKGLGKRAFPGGAFHFFNTRHRILVKRIPGRCKPEEFKSQIQQV